VIGLNSGDLVGSLLFHPLTSNGARRSELGEDDMNGIFTAVVAATIAGAAVTPVVLAPAARAADIVVKFGDLDLASAQGQATFDQRLDAAGRELCRQAPHEGSMIPNERACRVAAHQEAMDTLAVAAPQAYAALTRTQLPGRQHRKV
jgi:UrcA family protein